MAHSDPLPDDVLVNIADEISTRLSAPTGVMERRADSGFSLGEHFAVWMLRLEDLSKITSDLSERAMQTGYWHHQIRHDQETSLYARTRPLGPNAADWSIEEIGSSEIASHIDQAITWIDDNSAGDPTVRLLIVPAFYLHAFWLVEQGKSEVLIVDRPEQYSDLEYCHLYGSEEFLDILKHQQHASGVPDRMPLPS